MGLSTLAAPYTSLGLRDSHASSHVQQAISNGTVRIWHHANDADDAVQDGEGEGEWPAYVLGVGSVPPANCSCASAPKLTL